MILDVQSEVVLGGGSASFLKSDVPGSKRKGDKNYIQLFRDAGYPDSVDVKRPLAIFASNFPDYYETWGAKPDGPFVSAIQDVDGNYVANEAYISACILGRKTRKKTVRYDKRRYKRRSRLEIMF